MRPLHVQPTVSGCVDEMSFFTLEIPSRLHSTRRSLKRTLPSRTPLACRALSTCILLFIRPCPVLVLGSLNAEARKKPPQHPPVYQPPTRYHGTLMRSGRGRSGSKTSNRLSTDRLNDACTTEIRLHKVERAMEGRIQMYGGRLEIDVLRAAVGEKRSVYRG